MNQTCYETSIFIWSIDMNFLKFHKLVKALGIAEAFAMAVKDLGSHKKAVAMIDGQEITDADGVAIDIQTIELGAGSKAADGAEEEEEDEEAMTPKAIAQLAAKSAAEAIAYAFPSDGKPRISGGTFRNDDERKFGWANFGEFAKGVKNASKGGSGNTDKRLMTKAPTTYGNESTGVDGGFAVPPDFVNAVRENTQAEDSLLSRTDNHVTSSNNVTIPVDMNADWNTTNGIQANSKGEGQQYTESKPILGEHNVRLHKITSLVPITDELLEDSSFLGSYLARKAGRKIDFEVSRQIISGGGNGEMLGILNAPCTISIAKVTSQDTASFVAKNVIAMWSRLYGPHAGNAVWLINQDVIPQLHDMSLPGKDETGTSGTAYGTNVYNPANGFADAPFGTLYGRPVIPHQACSTLGTAGDVILADLREYMTLTKAGGIKADQSAHLYFDYDMQAFKFTLRVGGQPWWPTTLAAKNGSATYSPFVTVETRA